MYSPGKAFKEFVNAIHQTVMKTHTGTIAANSPIYSHMNGIRVKRIDHSQNQVTLRSLHLQLHSRIHQLAFFGVTCDRGHILTTVKIISQHLAKGLLLLQVYPLQDRATTHQSRSLSARLAMSKREESSSPFHCLCPEFASLIG